MASTKFGSKNSHFQHMVLGFSFGYFTMDILHYFGHSLRASHLPVLGQPWSFLVILVLAEMTSPVQNLWSLARLRKNDVALAAKLHDFLSPVFYAFYTVARGVLAPVFVTKMGLVYASGAVDGVIPKWVWGSWMLLVTSGILASLLWISNHWIVFYEEKMIKKLK